MKSLKVKEEVQFTPYGDYIFAYEPLCYENRNFFILKVFPKDSLFLNFAIEIVKSEEDWCLAVPTILYSDENDKIFKIESVENYSSDQYYSSHIDILMDFLEYFGEKVEIESQSAISMVKEMIDKGDYCYYYADGNINHFSLEVLSFEIEGKMTEGIYFGNALFTDIVLKHKNSGKVAELPSVQYDGVFDFSEEEDIDYMFACFLSTLREEDIKPYILRSLS